MKLLPLLGLLLLCAASAGAQDKAVVVSVVGYEGLKEAVLKERGKVVVVDFWADFCIPCKKNLPHLVELQRQHADKGLAVITVSIDPYKQEPEVKGRLEAFLTKQGAAFRANLLLDAPPPEWQKKLRFESVPTVYVFDRRGKWVQFTDDQYDVERIDRLVLELLNERP